MDWLLATAPSWVTLLGFLAATFGAGSTGALFKPGSWYRSLSKPVWTPPDWLFPIAWSLIYLAISVAAWWISLNPSVWAVPALALWSWQIVMNALWSPVFFGLRRLGAAMGVMVFLWTSVAITTALFWWIDPFAGWLMLPYLIWVSYAGALNAAIWRRNGDVSGGIAARA